MLCKWRSQCVPYFGKITSRISMRSFTGGSTCALTKSQEIRCTPLAMRRCWHVYRLAASRSEEHTSELQSPCNLVCRLLLEKKKKLPCTSNLSESSANNTYTLTMSFSHALDSLMDLEKCDRIIIVVHAAVPDHSMAADVYTI